MMKDLHNKLRCSVTIFLSLTITIILSLILILMESSRVVSLRTYYTDVSYLSMDSLFGSYCNELWQDYGLLGINTSDIDVDATLSKYITDNITSSTLIDLFDTNFNMLKGNLESLSSLNHTYLTDDSGIIFSNQVKEYMKYASINNISEFFENYFGNEHYDIYDYSDSGYIPSGETISKYDVEHEKDYSLTLDLSSDEAEEYYNSLSEAITHHLRKNTLLLLVDDPTSISSVTIDKSLLPSVTCTTAETVAIAEGYLEDTSAYTTEKIVLEEYISSHFGCYTDVKPSTNLKYELEYILMGQTNDESNLLSTAVHLVLLRASFNSMHILSDAAKYTAADNLAYKAVGWLNLPPLTLLTKYYIISLWSTAEAFIDVKDLLAGKKVPLIKDNSSWTLSLGDASSLSPDTRSKNPGTSGMSYIDYLKVLLIAESELALRYRSMDLIQLNIRHRYNDSFCLNRCLCSMEANVVLSSNNSFLNLSKITLLNTKSKFNINVKYTYK